MDNRINSGVSFQANMVTSIKGRNNIMGPVAKKFAEMTKDINGNFRIDRVRDLGLTAKDHYYEIAYGEASFITNKLNDLLSQDYSNVGSEGVKAVAKKMEATFRALVAEINYRKDAKVTLGKINELNTSIKRAEAAKKRADYYKLEDLSNVYISTINKYKEDVSKSIDKIKSRQERTLKQIDELMDKGIDLKTYKESVVDTFSESFI